MQHMECSFQLLSKCTKQVCSILYTFVHPEKCTYHPVDIKASTS